MAKRELITKEDTKEYLYTNMNWYNEDGYITDDSEKMNAISDLVDGVSVIPEQEIVKPYLKQLRAEIISSIEDIKGVYNHNTPEIDRPSCKIARNTVRLEIIDMINKLLSEQGDGNSE